MKKIDCKNFIHTDGHSVACTHVVWFRLVTAVACTRVVWFMLVTAVACASWLSKIFTYLHAYSADCEWHFKGSCK